MVCGTEKKSYLDRYARSMSSHKTAHAHSIHKGFRSHLQAPEHASTNAANYNEHIMSLYQALDYSYNPMKTKLYYCSTSNRVNRTVHYVWM